MGDSTSPILLTDVPQPIATFNKPFELSELVGNLDAIFYLLGYDTFAVKCIEISDGSSNKYVLGQSAETYFAELSLEDSSLFAKANGTGAYLFDLDFKHQNRKFFELANGTYAVALPWLGLDADSKVLVSVSGESSGKTVTIHYVDNDYRAWGLAGGGIREISWFNQLLTSANITNIVSLVDEIIKLEYSPEAAGGITVTSTNTQPTTVTGDWNLFSDGSSFIPLRIVSRFPDGSPQTSNILCILNRMPSLEEINGKLSVIAYANNQIMKTSSWNHYTQADNSFNSRTYNMMILQMREENGEIRVYSQNPGLGYKYYDIDFDHQFRRSLPADFVKMNVQIPQLLANPSTGQGFGIMHEASDSEVFSVYCQSGTYDPRVIEDNIMTRGTGNWANSLSWDNVRALLGAIIAMEFEGYEETPPSITWSDYSEQEASGFVVTPLIPQTLS